MPVPSLESKRLLLAGVSLKDAPSYQKNFADYEVVRHLNTRVPWPYPESGAGDYIENHILPTQEKDRWTWGLFLKSAPTELIGGVELWRATNGENRGFWLGKKYWGQGLMSEAIEVITDFAFQSLGFTVLYFTNARGNLGSRRIKEKTGATFLRIESAEGEFVDPQYTQREIWILKKQDWLNRNLRH